MSRGACRKLLFPASRRRPGVITNRSLNSRRFALLLAAAMSVVPALATEDSAATATVYVVPEGHDANQGTEASPLATLQKAQAVVREMKKTAQGPIEVILLPGTYYLGESLVFGPEDSGTKERRSRIEPRRRAARLSAAARDSMLPGGPIRTASSSAIYPSPRGANSSFPSCLSTVGGRFVPAIPTVTAASRSRPATSARKAPTNGRKKNCTTIRPPSRGRSGPIPKTPWCSASSASVSTRSRSGTGSGTSAAWTARASAPAGQRRPPATPLPLHAGVQPGHLSEYAVLRGEPARGTGLPGEWYLDPREGKLYYMPAEGVDLKTAVVEPALLQRVIQFRGTKENPVHHITLRGLRIAQAASTYFESYSPAGMGDYTIHRGGAVFIEAPRTSPSTAAPWKATAATVST